MKYTVKHNQSAILVPFKICRKIKDMNLILLLYNHHITVGREAITLIWYYTNEDPYTSKLEGRGKE